MNAHKIEIKKALKEGKAEDNRWHIRKDGSKFWAYGLVFPLLGKDEEMLGYVKILRNLTEAKKLQDANKKSQAEIKKYLKAVEELNAKKESLLQTLTMEKKRSDDLLLNILPAGIAEELKQNGTAEAKKYNNV